MPALVQLVADTVARAEREGDTEDLFEALYLAVTYYSAFGMVDEAVSAATRLAPMDSHDAQCSWGVATSFEHLPEYHQLALSHVHQGLAAVQRTRDTWQRYTNEVRLRSLELSIVAARDPASAEVGFVLDRLFELASCQRVFYSETLLAALEAVGRAGQLTIRAGSVLNCMSMDLHWVASRGTDVVPQISRVADLAALVPGDSEFGI